MEGPNYGATGLKGGLVTPDQSKTFIFFFSRPKEFPAESREKGYPVWKDVEYVRVQQPGERDAVELEAHDGHRQRWPAEYARYQQGKEQVPDGTPLSILLPGSDAVVMTMRTLGIFTVEQLAAMADSAVGNLPFGGELKSRAKRYLAQQEGSLDFNKMQSEIDAAKSEAGDLKRQLEDMKQAMLSMQAKSETTAQPSSGLSAADIQTMIAAAVAAAQPVRNKPGRKPKVQEA